MRQAALHGQYCTSGMQSGRYGGDRGKSGHCMCLDLQSSRHFAKARSVPRWLSHWGLGCCMPPGQMRGLTGVIGGQKSKKRGKRRGKKQALPLRQAVHVAYRSHGVRQRRQVRPFGSVHRCRYRQLTVWLWLGRDLCSGRPALQQACTCSRKEATSDGENRGFWYLCSAIPDRAWASQHAQSLHVERSEHC